jgi:hypothetical protein
MRRYDKIRVREETDLFLESQATCIDLRQSAESQQVLDVLAFIIATEAIP